MSNDTRMRTDRHNNPTAFTTDIAKTAGLTVGTDYVEGDDFKVGGVIFHTARLLHDPVGLTIKVIDKISFYTRAGSQRWIYVALPQWLWMSLTKSEKMSVIKFMYEHEGGSELKGLFV